MKTVMIIVDYKKQKNIFCPRATSCLSKYYPDNPLSIRRITSSSHAVIKNRNSWMQPLEMRLKFTGLKVRYL